MAGVRRGGELFFPLFIRKAMERREGDVTKNFFVTAVGDAEFRNGDSLSFSFSFFFVVVVIQ